MNIVLVAQNYHPYVGGVEVHVRQLAHQLAKKHRVTVVAGNFAHCRLPARLAVLHTSLLAPNYESHCDGDVPVKALTPTWADRLRMLPIAVRSTPVLSRYGYHALNGFGYGWYRSVYQPRLRHLMKGADVVHTVAGGYLGATAQAAARELGVPFVSTPFVHPHQWGDDPLSVAFYQRADAVVALVESDRRYLHSLGVPSEKLHVIGLSPDLPATSDPEGFRRRHGLIGKPVVLYLGRMMPQKGAGALLEATARVWQEIPDTHFVFAGPTQKESAGWFHGVDPRILYLGPLDTAGKADPLAACDVFCMPSMSEILPIVYLEAWSYGKPVVGGDAPGLRELVQGNGAGITVRQSPAEISAAVLRLLKDDNLRACLGQRGRELVEKQYSVEAVTGAFESLYRNLWRYS